MERLGLRNLSVCFAGGCFGALANSLLVWYLGRLGVPREFGVGIAPEWSLQFLYPRLVWGGLWGMLFMVPLWDRGFWTSVFSRGVLLSLFPTAFQLLYAFPVWQKKGLMGVALGRLTPLFVFFFNAVWGVVAALWVYASAGRPGRKLKL